MPDSRTTTPASEAFRAPGAPPLTWGETPAAFTSTSDAARPLPPSDVQVGLPLAREGEVRPGAADAQDALMTRVVRRAIDAYYDQPELRHTQRGAGPAGAAAMGSARRLLDFLTGRRAALAGRVPDDMPRPTLTSVRRVLHACRDEWLVEERLTNAARLAAEDAREHGLAAERMLVGLKRAWAELEEAQALPLTDARELLDSLVTLSIRAYYAPVAEVQPAAAAG